MKDPFDVDEFIERLAWRTSGGASRVNPDDFDPWSLHAAFEKTIKDLKELNVKTQKKIDKLEAQCKDEEKNNWQKVTELQKSNQVCYLLSGTRAFELNVSRAHICWLTSHIYLLKL